MKNCCGFKAIYKITDLIKHYQTKKIKKKPSEIDFDKYKITSDPSGYYTIINPKIDKIGFIERIKNIQKVWVKNDTLYTKPLLKGNSSTKYIPAANNEFRYSGSDLIGLAQINDPLDGQIIVSYDFLKQISPLWAYSLIFMFFSFFIILISTVIFGLLWVMVYLFGKKKSKTALCICLWPLITDIFIYIVIISILIKV